MFPLPFQVFDDVFVGSPAVLPESAPVRKLNKFFQIELLFFKLARLVIICNFSWQFGIADEMIRV